MVCEHERAPPATQLGHVCTALAEGGQLRLGHVEPTEGLVERHGTHALDEARAPLLLSCRGGALVARGACPLEEQLVREDALLHVVEDELRGLLLPYPRGAIADYWEEESLLRFRAPTCLGLPTHGALSQFGFLCLGFATIYNSQYVRPPSIVF